MSKISKVLGTVAVVAVATVIGRSAGYLVGSHMSNTGTTSGSVSTATTESSTDSTAPSPAVTKVVIPTIDVSSLLVQHRVFRTDTSEEHLGYELVFYEGDSKKLVQLNEEYLFKKSAGYTLESVQSVGLDEIYAGAEALDFVTKEVTDQGDYVRLVIAYNNLEENQNLKDLNDLGVIILEDNFGDHNYVNADTLCQSMLDNGKTELAAMDFPDSLNYTVNE